MSCPSLSGGALLQINPFHVAGRIAYSAVQSSKGRYGFTVTKLSTGIFQINFNTAHPDGANFIALASGEAWQGSCWNIVNYANTGAFANTSTRTIWVVRDSNLTEVNGAFDFAVLA